MVDIANTILGKIVDRKQEEFAARLKQRSLNDLEQLAQAATPVRGFAQSLKSKRPGVIAEIKRPRHLKGLFVKTLIRLKLPSNMKLPVLPVCLY